MGESSRDARPGPNDSTPSQEIPSVVRSSEKSNASRDAGRTADSSPTLANPEEDAESGTERGRPMSILSVEDETPAETLQTAASDNGLSSSSNSQDPPDVSMPPSLGRPGSAPTVGPKETSTASELPGIRVTTRGPRQIMIRQTSPFEIRVENRGAIDADGVLVRTLVPQWAGIEGQDVTAGNVTVETEGSARRLTWKIDRLAAGRTARLLLQLKASRSGSLALDVDWTLTPRKSVAEMHVREPKLELSIDGPEKVVYGQSQTYQIRVLNPGDGIAPDVVFTLSPNSPTPQSQRIGDIPPGKEAQFEVQLTAKDRGKLKIDGLAVGDLELRAEAAKTIQVAAAKLEAVLAGPELQYQNTQAHYRLEVENTGDAASAEIVATVRLPDGVEYKGGIDGARQRGGELRWTIDSLSPGAVRQFEFDCQMASTGDQRIAFECSGSAAGEADVSIATRVKAIADLGLTVNDPPAPAPVGGEVTYEIRIRNRGSKEATDVEAVAQFSHGIEPIRTEGRGGNVMEGQVLFDAIPRIDAGDEVRLRVIAKADQAGSHRFRCEVRGGETVLVAEEATRYMNTAGQRVSRRSSDRKSR